MTFGQQQKLGLHGAVYKQRFAEMADAIARNADGGHAELPCRKAVDLLSSHDAKQEQIVRAVVAAAIFSALVFPAFAQEDDAMEAQRCIWRCLADSNGADDPAYQQCVSRFCNGEPAAKKRLTHHKKPPLTTKYRTKAAPPKVKPRSGVMVRKIQPRIVYVD